jgi:hypothetical protein
MKNKLTILKVATIGAIMTASLVGCSSAGGQKLSSDDEKKFVEQVNTMVSERKAPKEVETTVDSKIKQLDTESATSVVNAYIYSLYQANSDMTNKISSVTPDLQTLVKDKKIDLSKKVEANKLEDGMVKGLFQELTKDHLILQQDGNNFFTNVDMDYVVGKYGTQIDSDLKDFMIFRAMEDKKSIFNSEKTTFDLDEVASRLVTIEKKDADIQKSKNKDQWISEQKYYYNIMFGVNHAYFLEKTDVAKAQTGSQTTGEAPKIQAEIVTKYKDLIKNNPDTQLAKDIQGFVDVLDKSTNKLDATASTYTTQLMAKKFPEPTTPNDSKLKVEGQSTTDTTDPTEATK